MIYCCYKHHISDCYKQYIYVMIYYDDILLFSYHLPPGFAMAWHQVSDLYTLALLTGGPQAKLVPGRGILGPGFFLARHNLVGG